MMKQTTLTFDDRAAITALINQYAHCADTRDTEGQMALFTPTARFAVYYEPQAATPTQEFHGREALRPVFAALKAYTATMHFNGQVTITETAGRVTALTYCLAHHVTRHATAQQLMVAGLRYADAFIKENNRWFFAERTIFVDWIENR